MCSLQSSCTRMHLSLLGCFKERNMKSTTIMGSIGYILEIYRGYRGIMEKKMETNI